MKREKEEAGREREGEERLETGLGERKRERKGRKERKREEIER